MPIRFVSGDPLLTQQQTLAFGFNLRARSEITPLALAVERQWPTAFAAYRKQTKRGRIKAGDVWLWHDTTPKLAFWIVRESSVGATRPRFVYSAGLRTRRDYMLDGVQSLAIAPLGRDHESESIREALSLTLVNAPLDIIVYTDYIAGVFAEAPNED